MHTNDLHGHLEKWDVLAESIQKRRSDIERRGDFCLVCDVGDAIDTVHPLIEASQGSVIVDLFNKANYDVVTIGNNEGLNLSKMQLNKIYSKAHFSVVCANLIDRTTNRLAAYAVENQIFDFPFGQIAFLGLTAPYYTYKYNGYMPLDIFRTLSQQLRLLSTRSIKPVKIILLSHLGYQNDRIIAQHFPEINLILGGHTHHLIENGEKVYRSLLSACGRFGEYLGEVIFDIETGEVNASTQSYTTLQSNINHLSSDHYQKTGESLLKKHVFAKLPVSIYSSEIKGRHSFVQHAFKAIQLETGCQLAFMSTGLFLNDLPKGLLSMNQLHVALPHSIRAMTLELKGWQLEELLEEIEKQQIALENKPIFGNGFRGKFFGKMIFKGIVYDQSSKQWLINDKPINTNQIYHLASLDHYAYIPFFPSIMKYSRPNIIFPKFLRHILKDYFEGQFPLNEGVNYD
nr:5'-nucleotidase C-terminal domain-containing protein [Facklamia miroungae]